MKGVRSLVTTLNSLLSKVPTNHVYAYCFGTGRKRFFVSTNEFELITFSEFSFDRSISLASPATIVLCYKLFLRP